MYEYRTSWCPGAERERRLSVLLLILVWSYFTGDLLRAAVKLNLLWALRRKKHMDAGQLVPDQLVIDLVKERLGADDAQRFHFGRIPAQYRSSGHLIRSFPKWDFLDAALLVSVKPEVIIERLSSVTRRSCGYTAPPALIPPSKRRRCISAMTTSGTIKKIAWMSTRTRQVRSLSIIKATAF